LVTAPTLVVLTSITVTGSGGALQQAIDVTWHVTDAFVTSGGFINVQHAVNAANPIWIADQSVPGEEQETIITGVNSGTTYLVRIRAVNSSGRGQRVGAEVHHRLAVHFLTGEPPTWVPISQPCSRCS
jgi:hypothetical protein